MDKTIEINGLEVIDSKYKIKFKEPYIFEGNTYTEIDLTSIQNVKATHMIKAQQLMEKLGLISVITEMSLPYACVLASLVTDQPIEFYNNLPGPEAIKLKNVITNFLYS